MRRNGSSGFRLNGLTIVLMLVLLCLAMFGLLSLSSARAAGSLCDKNAAHLASYAECDAEAQRRLAEAADSALTGARNADLVYSGGGARAEFVTARHGGLAISVSASLDGGAVKIETYRLLTQNDGGYGSSEINLWS